MFELIFKYTTDSMFGHGIQRWIQSRINSNGNGKNFLYRFAADNEMNYFKNELFNSSDFPGACHGDEVMHLFKLDETVMKNVKLPAIDSTGFKVSKLLVNQFLVVQNESLICFSLDFIVD